MNIPFQAIDWTEIEKTEHKGERGTSWWQTVQFGGLRLRKVEYEAGYLADHWCQKGHIVHCLQGSFTSELRSGGEVALQAGDTYIVTDELSSHRSRSIEGVQLLIIDGDFLKWQGAGLLPNHLETERLVLDIVRIADSDFIRELVNTEGWIRFIGDRNVQTDADAVRYIQKMIEGPDATIHVARLRDKGIPIGITTLIQRPYLDAPDIGFALLPAYEGKGYSREASAAIIDALTTAGTLSQVLAMTLPDNERSIRLLERLGLQLDRREMIDGEELLIFKMPLERKNPAAAGQAADSLCSLGFTQII